MLGKRERVVMETLLPSPHFQPGEGTVGSGFGEAYAEFERNANLSWRFSLRLALLAAVWLSPLLIGRMPPLSLGDRPSREAALAALGSSRFGVLRQLLFVLKSVACFCYGPPSDVRLALGLSPLERDEAAEG
jgi:hypothetical protein